MEKQERLAAQLAKLTKSLEQTEEKIKRSLLEGKVSNKAMQQWWCWHCRGKPRLSAWDIAQARVFMRHRAQQ